MSGQHRDAGFTMNTFRGRSEFNVDPAGFESLDGTKKRRMLSRQMTRALLMHDNLFSPLGSVVESRFEEDEESQKILPSLPKEESQANLKEKLSPTHPRNAGEYTVVAFINCGSGGGVGDAIFKDLVKMLGEEYVFDLQSCKLGQMPHDKLLPMALDPNVRVLACGGDGTVGWILHEIDTVWKRTLEGKRVDQSEYKYHLPLAIMPLGTGNDLSRTLNWGTAFHNKMKKPGEIERVQKGQLIKLDRWRCLILPSESLDDEARKNVSQMLSAKVGSKSIALLNNSFDFNEKSNGNIVRKKSKRTSFFPRNNRLSTMNLTPSAQIFDGVFSNYLSIGFVARVALSFHSDREKNPERFSSPMKNKLIYAEKAFQDGGLGLHITKNEEDIPPLLHGKIRLLVSYSENELTEIPIPKKCRGITFLNIPSYAAGHNICTKGKYNDGLLEVVFMESLSQLVRSCITGPISKFKPQAQAQKILMRLIEPLHCEVDGEPWLQSEGIIQIDHFGENVMLENRTAISFGCKCQEETVL